MAILVKQDKTVLAWRLHSNKTKLVHLGAKDCQTKVIIEEMAYKEQTLWLTFVAKLPYLTRIIVYTLFSTLQLSPPLVASGKKWKRSWCSFSERGSRLF